MKKKILDIVLITMFLLQIFVISSQFQTNLINSNYKENSNEIESKNDLEVTQNLSNVTPGSDEKKFETTLNDPVLSNENHKLFSSNLKTGQQLEVGESVKVDFSSVNKTTKEILTEEYLGTQYIGNFSESKLECPVTYGGDNVLECSAWIDSYGEYIYILKYFDTDLFFGQSEYAWIYEFLPNGSFSREVEITSQIANWDQGIFDFQVNKDYLTYIFDDTSNLQLKYYFVANLTFYQTKTLTFGTNTMKYEIDNNYWYFPFSNGSVQHFLRISHIKTLTKIKDVLFLNVPATPVFNDVTHDEKTVFISVLSQFSTPVHRIFRVFKESPYSTSTFLTLEYNPTHLEINTDNQELFVFNSSDNTIRVYDILTANYLKEFRLNGSEFGFYKNFKDFSFLSSWNEETWFTKNLFILDYMDYSLEESFENVFIWEFERESSTQKFFQENINIDDSKEVLFWSRTTGLFVEFSAKISFLIYNIANPDLTGLKFRLAKIIEGETTEIFNTQYLTLTGISGSYGASEVIVNVLYGYTSAFSYVNISFFDTGSNTVISTGNTTVDSILTVQEMKLYIDYLYVQRNSFSQQIRTKYEYLDNNNFRHFLPIQNYEYRMNFTVNIPTKMNFTTIEPYAPVELNTYDYTFYNTLPVNYMIEFQSGTNKGLDYPRQPQILAIKDVTNQFFQDSSFENGWESDFTNRPTLEFEGIELNYTIVSEGISSVRLEKTDSGQSTFIGSVLDSGKYYFKFNYYVETINGNFVFYYYNGSWIPSLIISTSIQKNRWFSAFIEIHIIGTTTLSSITSNIAFETSSPAIVFLDNIELYKTETIITTKEQNVNTFETQFSYLTTYGLFSVNNLNITQDIKIRSDNSTIFSRNSFTNNLGIFAFDFKGTLNLLEYVLFSIIELENSIFPTNEYYFTPKTVGWVDYAEKELLDAWDFSEGDNEGFSQTNNIVTSSIENGYLTYTTTGTDPWVRVNNLNIESNYYNFLKIRLYSNTTLSNGLLIHWFYNSGFDFQIMGSLTANIWQVFTYDLSTEVNWYSNIITSFRLDLPQIPSSDFEIKVDYVYLTHRDSNLNFGFNWEFEENDYQDGWMDNGNYLGSSVSVDNGFIKFSGDGDQFDGIWIRDTELETNFDSDSFSKVIVSVKASNSIFFNIVALDTAENGLFSLGYTAITSNWIILTLSITQDFYGIRLAHNSTNSIIFYVDYVRVISDSPPNLYESSSYFILQNEQSVNYNAWIDDYYQGIYSSFQDIPKNLTVGTHTIRYQAFKSVLQEFSLPSAVYEYSYTITQADIMKIIIHDQSGKIINFDSFKTYIDGIRLFDQFVYVLDVSQTFNLTITDIFDNNIYQNTSENFEQFKEIQITLFSTKVLNVQPNPIYLYITRGSKIYSEWVLPQEIVKYYLESDSYNFTIVYSDDISGNFGASATNATSITFIYSVIVDTALVVSGFSVQDVYNNIISLQNDIDSVNTTLNYNRQNFTLQFTATNQNVTLLIYDSNFIIDTLNSNFTQIYSNFTAIINALNSNFTQIYSNFTYIIDSIAQLLGLFRVHFSIIDTLGIGLPFETALITVNDTRQLDENLYVFNNTFINVKGFDFFNTNLFDQNYTITENNQNINVSMVLYEMIAFNNGSFTSYVEIYKNGRLGLNITIPIGNAISFRLTEGNYDYKVYYFESETQKTQVNDPSLFTYNKKLVNVGKIAVSADFPSKLDFSTPKTTVDIIEKAKDTFFGTTFLIKIIEYAVIVTISYFLTNFFLRRAVGRHSQDPAYVPPRKKKDWLDEFEDKIGLKTDDKDLW